MKKLIAIAFHYFLPFKLSCLFKCELYFITQNAKTFFRLSWLPFILTQDKFWQEAIINCIAIEKSSVCKF